MALKSGKREYKPDLTVAEMLAVTPNRPDPPKRRRRLQGRYTRKSICEFFFEVFVANEVAERRFKKTNAAIVDMVVTEFPKNFKLHVTLRKGERNGVNHYRQKYNVGRLLPGRAIVHVSFRYNENGDRVDYATGRKLLTMTEQKTLLSRYTHKIMQSYAKFANKHKEPTDPAK